MTEPIRVDALSIQARHLTLLARDHPIGFGTGFIIEFEGGHFLLTNWHVLSGRNPETLQPEHSSGALPDQMIIKHHTKDLSLTVESVVDLVDVNGRKLWIQHPSASEVDIAALPVAGEELTQHPFDLSSANTDMLVQVSDIVSIVGFPYGLASYGNALPIWKTGHIASEPGLHFNGKPAILIDATTRQGMSGSLVVIKTSGKSSFLTHDGSLAHVFGSDVILFLGVYSGRINPLRGEDERFSSELGLVWKPHTILEMLRAPSQPLSDIEILHQQKLS